MDGALLRYEMQRKGVSVDQLCAAIGVSRSAFYRKIKGASEFTLGEIQKIMECLEIRDPGPIFFCNKSVVKDTFSKT